MAAKRSANNDDNVEFQSSAFDVVSSWLLGGRSAAAVTAAEANDVSTSTTNHVSSGASNDSARSGGSTRAPVTLYRPSASAKPSLSGRSYGATSGATATADGKTLTEHEKEMRKKLLRKSGSYTAAAALDAEAESALKAAHDEALDNEERELIAYRSARNASDASAATVDHTVAPAQEALVAKAPVALAVDSERSSKKRKLNAQDELLEKLRQDAARAKAKNLKAKLRQQRKKEQERKQKESAAAATGASSSS